MRPLILFLAIPLFAQPYRVMIQTGVPAKMRDGVTAGVFRQTTAGKFPVPAGAQALQFAIHARVGWRKDGLEMRGFSLFLIVVGGLLAFVNVPCLAQDFKPYAGSKLDEKASSEASAAAPGKQSQVYTTSDAFDKVYAFYKGLYKEYTMRSSGPKLPSGEQVKWAFFIVDGGKDLSSSKYWMKIQRPYVGGADGKDIRDTTVIQTVRAK